VRFTTRVANNVEKATPPACEMAREFGTSDQLGLLMLGASTGRFLGSLERDDLDLLSTGRLLPPDLLTSITPGANDTAQGHVTLAAPGTDSAGAGGCAQRRNIRWSPVIETARGGHRVCNRLAPPADGSERSGVRTVHCAARPDPRGFDLLAPPRVKTDTQPTQRVAIERPQAQRRIGMTAKRRRRTKERRISVSCGTGIITSTVPAIELREMLGKRGYQITTSECKAAEVGTKSNMLRPHVIVSPTHVGKATVPTFNGIPLPHARCPRRHAD
jgi:galactitol PTS system EIIB component